MKLRHSGATEGGEEKLEGGGGGGGKVCAHLSSLFSCRVLCVKLRGSVVATGSSDSTIRSAETVCLCTHVVHTWKCLCMCVFAFCPLSEYGVWRVATAYRC